MGIFLFILYAFALTFIFLYSGIQVHLAVLYLRFQKQKRLSTSAEPQLPDNESDWPMVTVQLPVYNELYVVERLINAVCEFDYPKDRLEIQVLDDSNDETVELIDRVVAEQRAKGIMIEAVRRPERVGFKAGALQYGLGVAKGEFVAIFDADFVPYPDFLKNTIPYFEDEGIGVVQTRWEHINEKYSILTKLQAFALDAHFSVEQKGRNAAGHFINFNGTAGVWRAKCIEEAGGWQADTLTEDLDLSYRAQLKGWRFLFKESLGSPAELPAAMSAIKSQQFRWTKGAAETAKKNLWKVLKAKLPFGTKLHATFHLLNSFLFVCILMTALLSVPLLFLKGEDPLLSNAFNIASVFMLSLVALIFFFWVSRTNREEAKGTGKFLKFLGTFPLFLSISMGLSLHNAIATLEGYFGIKSPFIRTPKFNIKDVQDSWKEKSKYLSKSLTPSTVLEGLLCLYFVGGILLGVFLNDYSLVPYHALLMLGFGTIFYFSVRHTFVRA